MTERLVKIHVDVMEEWLRRTTPPLPRERILAALTHINELMTGFSPPNIVEVPSSISATEFSILIDAVGQGNSALLVGVRAGYCLTIAGQVLREGKINHRFDNLGCLE